MKRIFALYAVSLLILLGFLFACSGGLAESDAASTANPGDVPENISIRLPDSLDAATEKSTVSRGGTPTNSTGPAYRNLLAFVTGGKDISTTIDEILSTVAEYQSFFNDNIGVAWENPSTGEWVIYQTNTNNSYYLYHGNTADTTNFYIDWSMEGGHYKGKAWFFISELKDEEQAWVFFDKTLAQPNLDIYISYRSGELANLRVLITKLADLEVQVQACAVKRDGDDNWPSGWLIKGYGKSDLPGGGIGLATGATNITYTNDTDYTATNYRYSEYFSATGETLWKQGLVDLYEDEGTTLAFSDVIDPDETWTNENTIPDEAQSQLAGMNFLSNCAFPEIALP